MQRYSHQATPSASEVQEACIFAIKGLMRYDFASMRHIESAMQCTIDAALQNGGEFVDGMVHMFDLIMTEIGTDDAAKGDMQRFVARSDMVQFYLQQLCADTPAHDDDTFLAFDMVANICEGNADTTSRMLALDVIRTIDSACSTTPKTARWHEGRDKLLAIFASVSALP
jgi:hypothetical protein